MTIKADSYRSATKEYFDTHRDSWHTIKAVAKYLSMDPQRARYYVYRLEDSGLLESKYIKIPGSDGVNRETKHYKRKG